VDKKIQIEAFDQNNPGLQQKTVRLDLEEIEVLGIHH
jgi:hypothetical protein